MVLSLEIYTDPDAFSRDPYIGIYQIECGPMDNEPFGTALILPDGYTDTTFKNWFIESRLRTHLAVEVGKYIEQMTPQFGDHPKNVLDTPLVVVTGVCYARTWARLAYSGKANTLEPETVSAKLCCPDPEKDFFYWECKASPSLIDTATGPKEEELQDGRAVSANQCVGIQIREIKLFGRSWVDRVRSRTSISSNTSKRSFMSFRQKPRIP